MRMMVARDVEAPDLDQDPEEVKRALLQQTEAWIRSQPGIPTENGDKYRVHTESELVWVWDEEKAMTFDEKVVRHVYANDTIDFETVMDRPLRGAPLVDEHMYRRMGLCPSALLRSILRVVVWWPRSWRPSPRNQRSDRG